MNDQNLKEGGCLGIAAKTTWIPAIVLLWRKKKINVSSTLRLIVLSPVKKGVERLDGLNQIYPLDLVAHL